MMKYLSASLIVSILFSSCALQKAAKDTEDIAVRKIWDQAPHNAFTDLIRYKNAFYCTFREGPNHVSGPNGSARVLKSSNGKRWESIASFEMEKFDLRDPKLSITPGGRLMVLMDVESYENGKVATRKPYVSFSDASGEDFTEPVASAVDPEIAVKSDWVWRVTWHKGTGYAIDYQPNGIFLLKTSDGKAFEYVSKINVDGAPNEATIRFGEDGRMYVLIRREQGDKMGVLASSEAPYQHWSFNKLSERLGGPNFVFLDKETLCIGSRLYPQKDEGPATALFLTNLNGKILKTIKLPSGGDTSYPGMLIHKGRLWVSYYSSHEGKAAIYLAELPLSVLQAE